MNIILMICCFFIAEPQRTHEYAHWSSTVQVRIVLIFEIKTDLLKKSLTNFMHQ